MSKTNNSLEFRLDDPLLVVFVCGNRIDDTQERLQPIVEVDELSAFEMQLVCDTDVGHRAEDDGFVGDFAAAALRCFVRLLFE